MSRTNCVRAEENAGVMRKLPRQAEKEAQWSVGGIFTGSPPHFPTHLTSFRSAFARSASPCPHARYIFPVAAIFAVADAGYPLTFPQTIMGHVAVIPGRLAFSVHHSDDHTYQQIENFPQLFFFSGDYQERYEPFCADFGPVNLGVRIRHNGPFLKRVTFMEPFSCIASAPASHHVYITRNANRTEILSHLHVCRS